MYRFIESLRIEKHRPQHLGWHNKRLNETRQHFFGPVPEIDLEERLILPEKMDDGIYKCRILYGEKIEEVAFQLYQPRSIKTLRLVKDDHVDYTYKYEDRRLFEHLMAQKGDADDILIVKNGCMTDTSFSNIAFFDGKNWYTPDTFLLNGTCRQRLLADGTLQEARITLANLPAFSLVKPINAMLEPDKTPSVRLLF
jgi:4-amino-4-deoxychorismate lyase